VTEPISPCDVPSAKRFLIPDSIIECFNELIVKNFDGNSSVIYQNQLVDYILKSTNIKREDLFVKNYLDVERLYSDKGWDVYYDKPAYNETYEAHFVFTPK